MYNIQILVAVPKLVVVLSRSWNLLKKNFSMFRQRKKRRIKNTLINKKRSKKPRSPQRYGTKKNQVFLFY